MSLDYVQRALLTAVTTVLTPIPIASENMSMQPPTDAKWAALHFMPNNPTIKTLGGQTVGRDRVDGLLQVDLNYPVKTGTSEARADYEGIRAAFPAGEGLGYNGQEVVILTCGRSLGRIVDGWYRISITIGWYALISR